MALLFVLDPSLSGIVGEPDSGFHAVLGDQDDKLVVVLRFLCMAMRKSARCLNNQFVQ